MVSLIMAQVKVAAKISAQLSALDNPILLAHQQGINQRPHRNKKQPLGYFQIPLPTLLKIY